MRILHCIPTMLGGGAERQFCYLVDGLHRRGHEMHVALMREGPNMPRLIATKAHIHRLADRRAFDFGTLVEVCNIVRAADIDLVQSWLARMDVWAGMAAHVMRRPWVYTEQANPRFGKGVRSEALRRIRRTAHALATNSDVATSFWQAFAHWGKGRVVTIDSAVPVEEIRATKPLPRAALGVAEDAELVLFSGRLTVEKGIDLLADVLERFLKERSRGLAIICGEGPLMPSFVEDMSRRGLSERYLSLGYRTDIWSIMKAVDVCISTSNSEGRPNVLLEAIACETPIVVTDIPPHRDFLSDADALFFDKGDPVAGANALQTSIDDRDGTAARVRNAAKMIERFSIDSMAAAYESLYESLLHG